MAPERSSSRTGKGQTTRENWFFLSYARADFGIGKAYIPKFREELALTVKMKAALSSSVPIEKIGFFDQDAIDPGEEWDPALAEALQDAGAMVCLCTKAYFNSEPCGKEFTVFLDRLAAYRRGQAPGTPAPPLIIPVLWDRLDRMERGMPAAIRARQFNHLRFGETYAEEGLYQLMALHSNADRYTTLMTKLAELIADSVEQHPLPRLPQIEPFGRIKSAFHPDPAATPSPSAQPTTPAEYPEEGDGGGPEVAKFVFVAGRDEDLRPIKQVVKAYGSKGDEWRPYLPEKLTVGKISQRVAVDQNLYWETLPVASGLIDAIRQAESANNIVVLVVDPWTLQTELYRRPMLEFDQVSFVNCAVVVPWNDHDEETIQTTQALQAEVRRTFSRQLVNNPTYLKVGPGSPEELQQSLIAVIGETRRRIISRLQVFRPVGPSESAIVPLISGPQGSST